jgi:hypothetical protein
MNTHSGSTSEQRITKLAGIFGRWKFEEGRTVFEEPENQSLPFGICVSNVRFLDGEAQVFVKRTASTIEARILLGYRAPEQEYYTVGIGGGGKGYSIVHFRPGIGWFHIATAGSGQELPVERAIKICVKVRGQRILLEIDDVRVLEHTLPTPLPFGQLGLFTWGNQGEAEFTDILATTMRGDAFVVMQFTGFEELYTDVIEPLTREFGLRPYRADQVYGPGSIIEDIVRGIETAQIVIAEITPTNENVFYEVGYAHALKKPTILLADKDKKGALPFDLSGYRCLFYHNSIGGKRQVEEGLRKHLQAILDE